MAEESAILRRYGPAAQEEWEQVLRHFELGRGFAFLVVLVPDRTAALACWLELRRFLHVQGETLRWLAAERPEDLREYVGWLLDLPLDQDVGAVLLSASTPETDPAFPAWGEAWGQALSRLNERRDVLRERLSVPLLLVGAPWLKGVMRENAPDLWSVRSLVVELRPTKSGAASGRLAGRVAGYEARLRLVREWLQMPGGPDPERSRRRARRLGWGPEKQEMLARATEDYLARGNWTGAWTTVAMIAGHIRHTSKTLGLHALVETARGQPEQALASLADVLDGSDASDGNFFIRLAAGYAAFLLGDWSLAESHLRKALEGPTKLPEKLRHGRRVRHALGICLYVQGGVYRRVEGMEMLSSALSQRIEAGEPLSMLKENILALADILEETGSTAKALDLLQASLAEYEQDPSSRAEIAAALRRLLRTQGRFDEARAAPAPSALPASIQEAVQDALRSERKELEHRVDESVAALLDGYDVESPEFPSDDQNATLRHHGEIQEFEFRFEELEDLGGAEFLLPATIYTSGASADLFIHKSEYWGLTDAQQRRFSISDADWNDHVVLAEALLNLRIEVTLRLTMERDDHETLRFVDAEIETLEEVEVASIDG